MKNLVLIFTLLTFTLSTLNSKNDEYTGIYAFDQAPIQQLVVTDTNGTLYVYAEEVGKLELSASAEADMYTQAEHQATLKFVRDKNSGAVVSVQLTVQGETYEGKKKGVEWEEFQGNYQLDGLAEQGELNVKLVEGKLQITSVMGTSELVSTGQKDGFTLQATGDPVLFKRAADGKVRGIELEFGGNAYKGAKK
jgi:hypothetical protein